VRPSRLSLVFAGLLAFLAAGAASAAQDQAGLRIAKVTPLTIAGSGFPAGSRVRVAAATAGKVRARITVPATAAGSFVARFSPLLAVEPCRGALVVTATASSGERAAAKRPCRPGDAQTP
jgi:hypothetical protein